MRGSYNKKDLNLKKRCDCPRRSWDRCPHPFFFNYKGARGSLGEATRAEAKKKLADLKAQIDNGRYTKPTKPTPAVVHDERPSQATVAGYYLTQHVEAKLEPEATSRHRGFQAFLATVMLPGHVAFTDKPFRLLTLEDYETAIAAKRQRTATSITKKGKTWTRVTGGNVTANRMQAHLASMCAWAMHPKRAYLDRSPFSHAGRVPVELKKPQEHNRDRRLHPGEEDALLKFAPPHLRDCIVAALETGMRKGEVLSLQWKHVRWMQNELAIQWQNTKTQQSREIPISPTLRELLVRRQKTHPKDTPWTPTAYVFGNEIGVRVGDLRTAWDTTVLKAHGIERPRSQGGRLAQEHRTKLQEIDLHFHDLRHEAGSRKLEAGWPLHAVSRWLGHTKLTTTDTYLNATTRLLHDLNERPPLVLVKR